MPKKLTTNKFIEKATLVHNDQYCYDNVIYVDSKTKVLIDCYTHGQFIQTPNSHLMGQGCPACGRLKCDTNRKLSQIEFIKRANKKHNHRYNYDNTYYFRNDEKITVTCPVHGNFNQVAYDHLRGSGCQKCARTKYSVMAIEWLNNISQQESIDIQHADNIGEFPIPGSKYRADGYCRETNTIYEFYGDKWHGNPDVYNQTDLCNPFNDITAGELYQKTIEREQFIMNNGYNLKTMWESEYLNVN